MDLVFAMALVGCVVVFLSLMTGKWTKFCKNIRPMDDWEAALLSALKEPGWHFNHRDKSLIHTSGLVIVLDFSLPEVAYEMRYPAVKVVKSGKVIQSICDKIDEVAVYYDDSVEIPRFSIMETNAGIVSALRGQYPTSKSYDTRPDIRPHHRDGYLFEKTASGWTLHTKDGLSKRFMPTGEKIC